MRAHCEEEGRGEAGSLGLSVVPKQVIKEGGRGGGGEGRGEEGGEGRG